MFNNCFFMHHNISSRLFFLQVLVHSFSNDHLLLHILVLDSWHSFLRNELSKTLFVVLFNFDSRYYLLLWLERILFVLFDSSWFN
jgi:hypothetical protein